MDTEAIDEPMTEDNYGNFTRSQGGYAEPRVDASDAWDSMFRAMADPAPYKPSSKKPTSPFTPNIQKVDQMYHFAARHVAKEAGEDLTDKMGTYSALAEKWKGDDVDEIGMGTAVLIDKLGTEYAGSPESYFLAQGKPMPPFKTKTDIYRAVWRDFEQESIKIYKKNKETERVMLDAMDKVEKASLSYVQGTSFEHLPELLRYSQNPEEGIKSFTKARQAYALVNKIGFRDLDEFTRENSNSLHKIIGEDQYAFTLFADALRNKVESEGLDSIEFFTNIKRGLNKKSEEIGAFLDNRARLGKDAIDIGGGVVVPADSDGSPSDMWDEVVNVGRDLVGMERAPAKGKPMEESWEYQNKNSIDKLVGLISENEEIASKTKKDAAWYTKALNGAGRMLGDSSPFMMPNNSGLAMALMGELERASNSAALHGGTGFDIFVDASRNIVEEKALGAFSVFGKFGITGKLLKKLNKSSLVNLAAKAPLRSFVSGTKTGKFASTVLFQTAEELIGEPIAGNTYEALTSKAIALAGGELRAREFTPLKGIWESLNDPEEGAACIVFCGIMTGTAWRQATAEVADYVSSVERARLTGFTKAHARELANIKDDDVRTSKAKEYFDKDVLGDPAGASKRAQEAGRELISSQEAAWHNASGLAEKALKSVGVDKVEKLPDSGNYRVTMQAGSEGEASIYEMTSDQTAEMTRLALDDTRVNAIRDMQSRLMGDAIAESASKNIDYINVMDMFSDSAPAEYRASAEQLGGMSLKGMQDLSRRATERINSIMTSEGLTRAEAEKSVAPEILNGVALGSLETLPNKFTQRIDMAEESREITAQDARRLKEGNVRATNAHRFGIASDPTSSLIMVANGEASAREVLEDVVESAVVNIVGSGTSNWWNLWQQLSSLDKELSKYGVSIGADGGKADSMKVIEAFSNLALVDVIANADNMELTEDARNLIEFSLKNLEDTSYLMGLVDGYNEFISTDEGKRFLGENKNLVDLLDEAGATTQSIFKTARFNAEINQARLSLYQERAAQRQIRGDSRLTPEEQEESLAAAEQEDEEKITDEEKEGSGEGEVALNYSEVDVLTLDREGNVLDIAGESEVDPVAGAGFAENRFVRISNDCIMGLVNVDKLALAPDVEQFKEGATGGGIIKGKELQGKFDKNADPISVWRRKDGSLHVITGRHRFDLARREGVKVMPARIYTEDATHDVTWAKLHDIEKNIRDNQASAMEVAYYVRNNNRTKEWLQAEGLLRGGSIAEMGYDIASLACEDVFDRLKNGDITARQAYNICHASNTEKGQMVACRLIKEGKSLEYVNSYVREADRIVSGTEGDYDLFGNDDSWVKECAQVAEYVTKSVALINERLGILKKSNGLMRKKGEAEKMGIRLETPEDIKSHIIALERLKQEYQHHDTRLNIHGASMAWDGKSELNPFTHVRKDEGGDSGSFSLISPEQIHEQWADSLEEYLSGKNPKKDRDITVCPTPAVLRMLGAKAHDLVITPGVIDKVMHDKHAVSREAMEGLSQAIENPIAVFESATSANSLVLLTELKEGENNIIVAVQLNDKSGRISVNRVKSVYGKEDARALLCSSCFYWDIKKARLWLTASGLQLSAAVPSTKGRRRTMLKPADIVKWKDKNNVSFSVVSTDNRGTFDENNPDMSLSITQARHKGILSNGVIEAQNGTVVEPDVSFSLFAWHASPHSFRKFDTSKMGSGEGNQAYGWGVYLSTNKQVHDFYVDTFKKQGDVSQYVIEVNAKESQLMPWRYLESSIDKALSLSPIEELRYIANNSPESGRQVYEELMEAYWDGADDTKQGAMRQASEALLKSGIKGIKYEDGVSSNSITGRTFNYVIFDQDDIKITNVSDGGGWREYNDPEASFSVVSMDNTGKSLSAETFITKKDGNPDWLTIERGGKWKPVRLKIGEDKWKHKGFGLTHIVASRILDDSIFWDKMSPEKYIEDICNNVSELYEVGSRELLVKGKRPSQWLFIQLQEEGDFYSIVTAYPVKQDKKPIGKRVQLRRAISTLVVDQGDFDGSNADDATSQSPNTILNSKKTLSNSPESVNIKDVICQLNDGGTLPASFSLVNQKSNAKLDEEYFAAIKKGDMEKVQEMVNAQAKAKGYLVDEGWKDMHRAPSSKGAKSPEERLEESDDLSVLDMAQGVMNVPSDYWTHPEWYGNDDSMYRESFYKVSNAMDKVKQLTDENGKLKYIPAITVYRAVPKDIKEDSPRNADWVTPSRDYAQEHGNSRFGAGKYRIQSIRTKVDKLWWDGNSINEFGYDDGENYAYRNTKNNQKLLDPITYDYDHETDIRTIVPLSKRFNYRRWGTSFSLTTSESFWTRMYEAEFDAKLGTLHKKGAKSIEDWRKVCAAQDTPVAKIAEVYGEVMATVSAMYKVLPVGFRFAVEPYMKKATNAATELEGKEFLSPEMKGMRAKNVTQRMGEVMDSLLVRSEVQLEKYMKARIKRDMDKALKSLKIKKAPNGKSKKGKLSADNYRKLEEYTSMLNAKEEDKEEQVSILEGILQNTQSTEEQRDKAEESFADWAVFGCWKSMGIAEAKNAYASLMEFIITLHDRKQLRQALNGLQPYKHPAKKPLFLPPAIIIITRTGNRRTIKIAFSLGDSRNNSFPYLPSPLPSLFKRLPPCLFLPSNESSKTNMKTLKLIKAFYSHAPIHLKRHLLRFQLFNSILRGHFFTASELE